MAKRKAARDPLSTDETIELEIVEGLPPVEEYLTDWRAKLNFIVSKLSAKSKLNRTDANTLAVAKSALQEIEIIEISNSPSFVFKATVHLGAYLYQLRVFWFMGRRSRKVGKNTSRLDDDEKDAANV